MAVAMEVDEKSSEAKESALSPKKSTTIASSDLDVAAYAKAYSGKAQLDRLLHIARVCPSLKRACLEVCVATVRGGIDVGAYDRVMSAASALDSTTWALDAAWMSAQSQTNDKQVRYLEDEIQRWRNLSNREKICSSYLEAAAYCVSIGNLNTAISRYIEAKSYASDTAMLLDINLKIMACSIQSGQFGHVKSEASHALASEEIFAAGEHQRQFRSKVVCCLALYNLHNGRYDAAVHHFMDCHFSVHAAFGEVLSGRDIALYGGLCALAAFNRLQLKKRVLDNAEFKRFLELQPKVGALIQGFYDSEYGKVMSGLNGLRVCCTSVPDLFPEISDFVAKMRRTTCCWTCTCTRAWTTC